MLIDDGKGKGFVAGIDSNNRLLVTSVTSPLSSNISFLKGNNFVWNSSYAATANDYVFYLMNTDQSQYLRINRFIVSATGATSWTAIRVTGGTPGGTAITGLNTNFSSGKVASVTSLGNAAITGSPTGTTILKVRTGADSTLALTIDGSVILPVNTAIAIQVGASVTVNVTVSGWFDTIE